MQPALLKNISIIHKDLLIILIQRCKDIGTFRLYSFSAKTSKNQSIFAGIKEGFESTSDLSTAVFH